MGSPLAPPADDRLDRLERLVGQLVQSVQSGAGVQSAPAAAASEIPPGLPAEQVQVGQVYAYPHFDDYATPPGVREQLVLVTHKDADGGARGFPLSYRDEAAAFPGGSLHPVE